MKETKVYKQNYKREEEYYNLVGNISNNFLMDEKFLSSKSHERKYLGIEKNVLIRISLEFSRKDEKSDYKSVITIEKVGSNTKKISKIETFLLKKGFKSK